LNFNVIERQADEYSAFYCYVAGYKTDHIGEAVIDSIYKRFNLTDKKLKKYPKLSERKLIVKASQDKMKVLKLMFDHGNLALVSGNYEAAQKFYRTIIDYNYKSREMWNNLGVSYLLDAMDDLDSSDYPYLFPLQIDFNTYLEKSTVRSLDDYTEEKLEEALLYFGYAIQNSDDYAIGYLNKAITEFLLENYVQMNRTLEIAEQLYDPYINYSVNILRAIYLDKTGDKKKALKMLSDISYKSELASRNYKLIEGETGVSINSLYQESFKDTLRLEWPLPNYSSEHVVAGKKLIESLIDPNDKNANVSLKILNTDSFECMYWNIKKSKLEVIRKKEPLNFDDKNWSQQIQKSNIYYKFGNTEFAVFGSLILKKDLESIDLYRVK
jgi:tetratricopeptide (TPR) repeat protein